MFQILLFRLSINIVLSIISIKKNVQCLKKKKNIYEITNLIICNSWFTLQKSRSPAIFHLKIIYLIITKYNMCLEKGSEQRDQLIVTLYTTLSINHSLHKQLFRSFRTLSRHTLYIMTETPIAWVGRGRMTLIVILKWQGNGSLVTVLMSRFSPSMPVGPVILKWFFFIDIQFSGHLLQFSGHISWDFLKRYPKKILKKDNYLGAQG